MACLISSEHSLLENGRSGIWFDGLMNSFGSPVSETRVGSNLVVVSSPFLDQDLGLLAASEPFEAQAFVPELVIETLVGGIPPWLARVDGRGPQPGVSDT